MEINISDKKLELIQWLSTLNDKAIIEKLIKIRETEATDWWNEISKEEKSSISKGLDDAKKGNLKSHSEAKKIYGKWL